jgi:hypothetical protein
VQSLLEEEEETIDRRQEQDKAREEGADRQEFERSLIARRHLACQEMALQSREQREVERLGEMLQEWKDSGQWCGVNEWAGAKQHQLADCIQQQADGVREGVREMRKRVRWVKYSCCFQCGVPQSMCASYRERPDAGWDKIAGARCQFVKILIFSNGCRNKASTDLISTSRSIPPAIDLLYEPEREMAGSRIVAKSRGASPTIFTMSAS